MTPWSRTRTLKWTPVRSRLRRQMKSGLPETDLMPGFAWNRSQKTNRTVSCSPVNFVMLEFLKRAFIILYMYNNCLNYGMKSIWALGRSTEPKLSSVLALGKRDIKRQEFSRGNKNKNSLTQFSRVSKTYHSGGFKVIFCVHRACFPQAYWVIATNLRLKVKIWHQKLMPFLCSRYQSEW